MSRLGERVRFGFFVKWYIYIRGLFNTETILVEAQQWYYLTHGYSGGGDKEVHTFPKGINSKVNVIARVEFELTYLEAALQPRSHYTTRPVRGVGKKYT